jgi:hypothetical protein
MFSTTVKAKPDIENIRGLNLAEVRRTTVQMTTKPLYRELHELGHDLLCQAFYICYMHIILELLVQL